MVVDALEDCSCLPGGELLVPVCGDRYFTGGACREIANSAEVPSLAVAAVSHFGARRCCHFVLSFLLAVCDSMGAQWFR